MITDGNASDMEVWRRRDVFDFFYAMWSRENYLKAKAKALKPKHDESDGAERRDQVRG